MRMQNEQIIATVLRGGAEQTVTVPHGSTLAAILGLAGHPVDLPCGGRGVCRKCRVQAVGALSPPHPDEAAALADGLRLACLARALGTVRIALPEDAGFATAVCNGVGGTVNRDPLYHGVGAAVDIGTTTLAVRLYRDGEQLASGTAKNPQTAFGADVISRIGLALAGEGAALAASVRAGVNRLLAELCAGVGLTPALIDAAVVTGNTAMLYLLTERSPLALSAAPFAADWLAGEHTEAVQLGLELAPGAQVYLPRCISAFVGADITTAILASGMTDQPATALLADIGTNGELALWHGGRLTCCSTAAGPAFEGAGIVQGMHGVTGAIDHLWTADGQPICSVIGGGAARGLCGSAVVDAVAVLLALGALEESGRIERDGCVCPERITAQGSDLCFSLCNGVGLYGKDVRAVQLAKSAVCAGIQTLLHAAGLAPGGVERLWIAGGFGSYLDLDNAAAIGLIPGGLRGCAVAVGNAALSGAAMLLCDHGLIAASEQLAKSAQTLDLAANSFFMQQYVENMSFEA